MLRLVGPEELVAGNVVYVVVWEVGEVDRWG